MKDHVPDQNMERPGTRYLPSVQTANIICKAEAGWLSMVDYCVGRTGLLYTSMWRPLPIPSAKRICDSGTPFAAEVMCPEAGSLVQRWKDNENNENYRPVQKTCRCEEGGACHASSSAVERCGPPHLPPPAPAPRERVTVIVGAP